MIDPQEAPKRGRGRIWTRIGAVAFATAAATALLPGIHSDHIVAPLVAGAGLALVHVYVRPLLAVISLPALILSFGLLWPVLNGFLLWGVAQLTPAFHIESVSYTHLTLPTNREM